MWAARLRCIEARDPSPPVDELLDPLVQPVDPPAICTGVLLGVFPLPDDPGLVVVFRGGERSLVVPQARGTQRYLAMCIIRKATESAG